LTSRRVCPVGLSRSDGRRWRSLLIPETSITATTSADSDTSILDQTHVKRAPGAFCVHSEICEGVESARCVIGWAGDLGDEVEEIETKYMPPVATKEIAVAVKSSNPDHAGLLRLIRDTDGTPVERVEFAFSSLARRPYAALVIVSGVLVVAVLGENLYWQERRMGLFFGSCRFDTIFLNHTLCRDGVYLAEDLLARNLPADTR
jgi:hypothetical protein